MRPLLPAGGDDIVRKVYLIIQIIALNLVLRAGLTSSLQDPAIKKEIQRLWVL